MKKITFLLIAIILSLQNISGFAYNNITATVENSQNIDSFNMTINNGEIGVTTINQQSYVVSKCRSFAFEPTIYDEIIESHFPKELYIDIGDYFYTRELNYDYPYIPATWKYNVNPKIKLYNKKFELEKIANLGETAFPRNIWYENDMYYCSYYQFYKKSADTYVPANTSDIYYGQIDTKYLITVASKDFENWNIIDSENIGLYSTKPYNNRVIENDKVKLKGNQVSFKNNNIFQNILYENNLYNNIITKVGNLFLSVNSENDLLLSSDNIYFINIVLPEDASNFLENLNKGLANILYIYEYNDNIKIQLGTYDDLKSKLVITQEDLIQSLKLISKSPYIKLNNNILGFSQPPVMENNRILVPMRFLFEQMGADVNWNEETQTATATVPINTDAQMRTFSSEKEKSVTFSIDNTIATVNGETATMDVPARLINDKTMVPLRFLSENLEYNVEWDEATNTAIITNE